MPQVEYPRLNVLVVEDQDMIREIVVAILRALGCGVVRSAADGQRALDMVAAEPPSLILCDISMQPMDGFQFVAALRQAGRRIPIIFLTAHSTADFVDRARQAGVEAYIVKPVKRAILEERIRHLFAAG